MLEEEINVDEILGVNRDTYALKARGDSMVDDHITDGDYVVLERRDAAKNGDIVVALLDTGEATLRRIFYQDDAGGAAHPSGAKMVKLQAGNPKFEPRLVEASRVRVQGVLIGVLRSYH